MASSSRRRIGGGATWLLLALLLARVPAARADEEQVASEHAVKAAFLYNFARFVEWPDETLPAAGRPFTMCVLGEDGVEPALVRAVADKTVNGRSLAVRHVAGREEAVGCQVVFVSARAPSGNVPAARGLLTVGEADGFTGAGGIIQFAIVEQRVRFRINQAAATRAGLKISSQLLSLAEGREP